jgi:hypothetical protein
LLQPLDVGVFQTLKRYFKDAVRQEVFMGAKELDKTDFFRLFQSFYNKSITPHICKSAFRRTGLIPYAPEKVLNKLQSYQATEIHELTTIQSSSPPSSPGFATPPSTPPSTNWLEWPTPLTLRTRKKGVEYIQERQKQAIQGTTPLTPSITRVFSKIEKASLTSILSGALSTNRLSDLARAADVRKPQKDHNRVVQKYGEIYGDQARRQIESDNEEEAKVVNLRESKKKAIWKKKYKKVVKQIADHFWDISLRNTNQDL